MSNVLNVHIQHEFEDNGYQEIVYGLYSPKLHGMTFRILVTLLRNCLMYVKCSHCFIRGEEEMHSRHSSRDGRSYTIGL